MQPMDLNLIYLIESNGADLVSTVKDVATIIGVIIALGTLMVGVYGYFHQGRQNRAEHFTEMRRKFAEDTRFQTIKDLLVTDDPELEKIPLKDKVDYLGFFEEIALMTRSGLISTEIAHYMFAYYAIRCWESDRFWTQQAAGSGGQYYAIDRNSGYWILFKNFVDEMQEIENQMNKTSPQQWFESNKKRFRF
jgi:hypothetical protein